MSSTPRAVHGLTGLLVAVGLATGAVASGPVADMWLLAPLAIALIVGESLQVEFKYGDEVRAVDVFEAVLGPVLITFAGPLAVVLAVVSKAVSQRRLGVDRTKAAFNVAQWAAAVGVASLVYRTLAGSQAGQTSTVPALAAGLLGFAVTNEIAMACVLRLVRRTSMRELLVDLAPGYPPHALIWSANAALGVLFAVAVVAAPATAFLLLGPLAFLRWSHQAFLAMRADRARLEGLTRAVAHLAAPIDPKDALPGFLDDVREAFSSTTVELVLFDPPSVLGCGAPCAHQSLSIELARRLVAAGGVCRASAAGADEQLAAALIAAGHREALVAPLLREGRVVGALASYDRTGFEGFEAGEEAVMSALAAVAARAIEKSELLGVIVEERRQLAEIVDRSSDGILTVAASGTIESWNPAMEAMTGLGAADVIGTRGLARLRPRDVEGDRVWFEHWSDEGIPDDVLITTPDGDRWLACTSAVGGGGDTLVIVARDATRAREIDRMKDDFIATVSHELRTPLATIRGFTELLDPPHAIPEATRAEAIGRIRKGTYRLERLVANLLEVTKIDARRAPDVLPAELDVCDIVSRVVDEVRESWPNRTIEVDTGGGAWRAQGSLLSLERILINLLSNALTYAPQGTVLLKVRAEGDDGVAVSIRDHGPGIPKHQQARIFDRFERLHTAQQKAGTGLGLYIARGLARGMGAEVTVASEVGQGAEFTVHLRTPESLGRSSVAELVG